MAGRLKKMFKKRLLYSLLYKEDGNILIELAIILPILFLLLFGGLDVSRYAQLVQKTDQTTAIFAEVIGDLSQSDQEASLERLLPFIQRQISFGAYNPQIKIQADYITFGADGRNSLNWSRSAGDTLANCPEDLEIPTFAMDEGEPSLPRHAFVRVEICVVAGSGFYLSNILSAGSSSYQSMFLHPVRSAVSGYKG